LYKFKSILCFYLGEEVRIVVLGLWHNNLEVFKTNGPRVFLGDKIQNSSSLQRLNAVNDIQAIVT
jgi:hypothetical protein